MATGVKRSCPKTDRRREKCRKGQERPDQSHKVEAMHTSNLMVMHTSLTVLLTPSPCGNIPDCKFIKHPAFFHFMTWCDFIRRGFEFWPSVFPRCGGKSQSPINIDRWELFGWSQSFFRSICRSHWSLDHIDIDRRLVVHRSLPRLHFHGYSKVK